MIEEKRSRMPESMLVHKYKELENCCLCPRDCGADRAHGQTGFCGQTIDIRAARAALHMWEEPCISGTTGSGTVFFSGCCLHCVFCQNHTIANGQRGKMISVERLADIFLDLQEKRASNINLVTAGHFAPQVAEALRLAKEKGLRIPVVYNSSGYESVQTLKRLEGLIDIYLPDFKYWSAETAKRYSNAADYRKIAKEAVAEMVRQVKGPVFEADLLKRGVIVRHLLLPGHVKEAKEIVRYLYETYGNRIYISLMNQYTPIEGIAEQGYPELARRVTRREYEKVIDFALEIGVENGYIQEGETAKESFIPDFDNTGI